MIPLSRRHAVRAEHLALVLAGPFALVIGYALVHHRYSVAVAFALLPGVAWLLTRSYGGLVAGLTLLLILPYWQTLGSAQLSVLRVASLLAVLPILLRRNVKPAVADYALVAFVSLIVLDWLLQNNEPHAGRIVSVELTPLGFYIGARAVPPSRVRLVMLITLVAGTLGALTVMYEYLKGHAVFLDPTQYVWNASDQTIFRPGGIFGSPPGASTVLACVLMIGLGSVGLERGRRRLLAAICCAVCTVAVVLTFTRAAIIGVGIAILVFAWLVHSPLLRPLRVAWFAAVVAVIVIGVLPMLSRNTTFEEGLARQGTLTVRESYWQSAIPLVLSSGHALVFGLGTAALEAPSVGNNVAIPENIAASPQVVENSIHSQYITTWVEQGLLGVGALITFLLSVFLPAARQARAAADPARAAIAAGIAAFAVVMTVDTALLHGPSFAILMLMSGLGVTLTGAGAPAGRSVRVHSATSSPVAVRT